ncbi:hypothetical protein BH24ACT1_BH24ACT1_11480 [soil metagenome]
MSTATVRSACVGRWPPCCCRWSPVRPTGTETKPCLARQPPWSGTGGDRLGDLLLSDGELGPDLDHEGIASDDGIGVCGDGVPRQPLPVVVRSTSNVSNAASERVVEELREYDSKLGEERLGFGASRGRVCRWQPRPSTATISSTRTTRTSLAPEFDPKIQVFLFCDAPLQTQRDSVCPSPRRASRSSGVLLDALRQLFAGPTASERQAGLGSYFSSDIPRSYCVA